jgi:hypothetical protein
MRTEFRRSAQREEMHSPRSQSVSSSQAPSSGEGAWHSPATHTMPVAQCVLELHVSRHASPPQVNGAQAVCVAAAQLPEPLHLRSLRSLPDAHEAAPQTVLVS